MSAAGSYAPRPGSAPLRRMVVRQAALEARLLLRNGEQLLLVAVLPVTLLVLLTTVPVVDTGSTPRIDFLAPGVLALAVLSTAFTGQAIATAYERRYGVLVRLAVSPLPRGGLLAGKTLAVLAVEAGQLVLVGGAALALGWRPALTGVPAAVLLAVAGTAACSALGLLLAGTVRAETALAAANLVYVLLLVTSGAVVPLERFPDAAQTVLGMSPLALLASGLRDALTGAAWPWAALLGLVGWAAAAGLLAARLFRFE